MVMNIGANYLLNHAEYISASGTLWNISVVVWLIGLYFIGRNINVHQSKRISFWLIILIASFSYAAVVFYDTNLQRMSMPPVGDDPVANYQGMARSVFFTVLFAMSVTRKLFVQFVILIGSTALLYLIGSRAELYMLLVIIPVWAWINMRWSMLFALVLMAVTIPAIAFFYSDALVGRMVPISEGDTSLSERYDLLISGVNQIVHSPLFGDYLGQVREFGGTGFYIHNILSVWQQHGALAFILYAYLVGASLYVGVSSILRKEKSEAVVLLTYVAFASLVGVVAAKALTWPIPALAWGLACQVSASRRVAVKPPAQPSPSTPLESRT